MASNPEPTPPSDLPEHLAERLRAGAEASIAAVDDVRMEDIARSTGIPRATLYYHFRSKEQVLAFLVTSLLDDITQRVHAEVPEDGDVTAAIERVMAIHLATMDTHPNTCRLLATDLGRASRTPEVQAALDRAFRTPVRALIARGIAQGRLSAVDPDLATTALFGALTLTALSQLHEHGSVEPGAVLETVVALAVHGLVAPDHTSVTGTSP